MQPNKKNTQKKAIRQERKANLETTCTFPTAELIRFHTYLQSSSSSIEKALPGDQNDNHRGHKEIIHSYLGLVRLINYVILIEPWITAPTKNMALSFLHQLCHPIAHHSDGKRIDFKQDFLDYSENGENTDIIIHGSDDVLVLLNEMIIHLMFRHVSSVEETMTQLCDSLGLAKEGLAQALQILDKLTPERKKKKKKKHEVDIKIRCFRLIHKDTRQTVILRSDTIRSSGPCFICHRSGGRKCSRCGLVYYCGPLHQKEHYPAHKIMCRKEKDGLLSRWLRKIHMRRVEFYSFGVDTDGQALVYLFQTHYYASQLDHWKCSDLFTLMAKVRRHMGEPVLKMKTRQFQRQDHHQRLLLPLEKVIEQHEGGSSLVSSPVPVIFCEYTLWMQYLSETEPSLHSYLQQLIDPHRHAANGTPLQRIKREVYEVMLKLPDKTDQVYFIPMLNHARMEKMTNDSSYHIGASLFRFCVEHRYPVTAIHPMVTMGQRIWDRCTKALQAGKDVELRLFETDETVLLQPFVADAQVCCFICGETAQMECPHCNLVHYCSPEHRWGHWDAQHQKQCHVRSNAAMTELCRLIRMHVLFRFNTKHPLGQKNFFDSHLLVEQLHAVTWTHLGKHRKVLSNLFDRLLTCVQKYRSSVQSEK